MSLQESQETNHINRMYNQCIRTLVRFVNTGFGQGILVGGIALTYEEWESIALEKFMESYETYYDPEKMAKRKAEGKVISKFNTYLTSSLNNFIRTCHSYRYIKKQIVLETDTMNDTSFVGYITDILDKIESYDIAEVDDFNTSFRQFLVSQEDNEVIDYYDKIQNKERLTTIKRSKRKELSNRLSIYYQFFTQD